MTTRGRWFDPEHVATWDDNPDRVNPTRAEQLEILSTLALAEWRPGDLVIDLACGTGHLEELLCARAPEMRITAVDYSPVVLERARQRLAAHLSQVDLIEGNVNDLGEILAPGGAYGIAISVQSFHHFSNSERRKQIVEIHRLLRPGGLLLAHDRFAIADDALLANYQSLWRRLEGLHGLELPDEPLPDRQDPEAAQAADLGWFLATLDKAGFSAAPMHLQGTRAVVAARKRVD